MRVSEQFSLDLPQHALDFVDVDTDGDTRVYLDPRALHLGTSQWGNECVSLIQDYFTSVLDAIREDREEDALKLLLQLKEPNETHLGQSKGKSRGRTLGPKMVRKIYRSLAGSSVIQTGRIQDLEETALMVEGIAFDIVSDIATNVMRGPLIDYTQTQAALLGFDDQLVTQSSGPMWDPVDGKWFQELRDLPISNGGKLLLVPKWIVRRTLHYNAANYISLGVLDFLEEDHIARGSSMVTMLKNGNPTVSRKELREKYGEGKRDATRLTLQHPEILNQYRQKRGKEAPAPLTHDELREKTDNPNPVDWDALVAGVKNVKPGAAGATAFHKTAQGLLTAALHPWLTNPVREAPIHDGRKRLDIRYTNTAQHGSFLWFATNHRAPTIAVECKNYTGDPKNPELDQLAGRFSPLRGQVGILVCRDFEQRPLFLERCRDTARDERGLILVLEDADLEFLADRRKNEDLDAIHRFFLDQAHYLTS